jgi:uncharacterized RDD family membrane protein YckC
MGFNISGIAISKNYKDSMEDLQRAFHWKLDGPYDINFETASANWKDEGICDVYFTPRGTLLFVNVNLCDEAWSIQDGNTLTFALSETSMAFNFNFCEGNTLKRSIMEVDGDRLNDTGEKLPAENGAADTSEVIWKQLEAVLGKRFWDIGPDEKAFRYRFVKKEQVAPQEKNAVLQPADKSYAVRGSESITPLQIEGISENLYAGFGSRLGSMLLDFIFVLPVVLLVLYLNGLGKNVFFYTIIPNLLFSVWYHVYLPKRYGGTPGKLTVGISIIRIDGQPIGWNEAILRHIVMLVLAILSAIIMSVSLMQADETTYMGLSWLEKSKYLMAFSPLFFSFYQWVSNIWVWGEFIVLLTNERKRAIHDFMAGTVIVKTKYVDKIRAVMS